MSTNPEVQALRNLIRDHEAKQKNKRKRNTKGTNELKKKIIRYVRAHGGYAARVNVSGFYRKELGKWITSGSTTGFPDIVCIKPGNTCSTFVGIETKQPGESQSDEQKLQQEAIINAGGEYWLITSYEVFLSLWNNGYPPL